MKKIGFLIFVILIGVSFMKVNVASETFDDFSLANIEALAASSREGVEDCDIFIYNRNQAETSELTTIQVEGGVKFYISYKGEKIKLGIDAEIGATVKYYYCEESMGNCCKKTWVSKPVEYL